MQTPEINIEEEQRFGYAQALAEVTEQLLAAERTRREAELARLRARHERRSLLLDARGLAHLSGGAPTLPPTQSRRRDGSLLALAIQRYTEV